MANITIKDRIFSFEIIRRQRKSVEIQIDSVNGFRVIAPKRLAEKAIMHLLEPRKEWIYEKMLEIEQAQAFRVVKNYADGEIFLILGIEYPLEIQIEPNRKRSVAVVENEKIIVRAPESSRDLIRTAVLTFYKKLAREEIERRIEPILKSLGVTCTRIAIKDQKRRWGSCSHLGNLNFNWRCVMMPEPVFEYIIAHEVCHLVHLNHSKAYWDLLETVCPYDKQAKLWLKQMGMLLDI